MPLPGNTCQQTMAHCERTKKWVLQGWICYGHVTLHYSREKKNDDDSESYKQTESIISFIKCFISLFFLYKKTPRSIVYIDWMLNDIQFK